MKHNQLIFGLVLVPALLISGCSGTTVSLGRAPQAASAAANPTSSAKVLEVSAPAANSKVQLPAASEPALAAYEGTLEQIYEQVGPSVVNIQVVSGGSSTSSRRFPGAQQGVQEALGSGFVWDQQGHIVTNNHVVSGANQITVTFSDGTEVDAKLVGADANSDLAVIQVDVAADRLHPVTLTDSSQVKVGQMAIAIGNPFGLSGTMTEGIISALSRSLPVGETSQSGATYSIPDIIQTDAAINPGNSGGVLVDSQGQVVGVTSAIQSSTDSNSGIGFVIPSNIVNRVVPSLIKTGKYDHPWIGITGTAMNSDLAKAMNLDANQKGVLVIETASNGPAEKAGLKGSQVQNSASGQIPVGGDIITAVDGHAVDSSDDLTSYLYSNAQVGQAITLTVLRDGKEMQVQVTLGVLPNQ
jgi:2-alkenal reductase